MAEMALQSHTHESDLQQPHAMVPNPNEQPLRKIVDYPMLVGLFEATHVDNMEILKALIYAHDDILPLYDGSVRKRINLEILRRKNILLLISDLDISNEGLSILEQMYLESRHQPTRPESFYEVVWLPVVDKSTPWTEDQQKQFEYLQNRMPWYSVHHPSMVDPAVIKYIKEKWKFGKKAILVVLDPQGRVANQNALHMMWIWGNLAFPFTSMREDALWREETWRLELLVDGIDQNILGWISEGRLICLYGGEDMEWIRKFTTQARNVSQIIREPIKLVYLGKSNPKERVRNNINNITNENLSHTWPDLTSIWFFWVRLESMWYSKVQFGKTIDNDSIMKEILTILSFDDSGQCWAVISRGSAEMTKAKGETILTSFTEIDQWKTHVEREGFVPALNNIVDYPMLAGLFEATHVDNMEILKALIYAHDFILPLYDGSVRKRINLEILRRKNILLLISDLDISYVELSILEQIYSESQHQPTGPESFYEVVWLPVVDRSTPWTEEKRQQFEDLQNSMPWYSVHHPSLVDPAVIKYIKEKWKFAKKPILVVLDPQGRVANQNALHMMWIWGSLAFPFTSMREDALWREETWRLELLVDGIDPNILNWISEGRLICLYGGEDMEWIRKFTRNVGHAMLKVNLPTELVYVGKSNPKERVRKIVNNITNENLSHTWPDLTSIWFFWVRLESMWYSKTQHGKTIDKDPIIKEILTMLRFDDSGQGWAVISGGSAEMAKAKGETILTSFTEIDQWKEQVEQKGFVPALIEYLHRRNHCLILPGTTKSVPDMVVCAECASVMEKFIMFRCCTESEHQVNLPDGTSTCIE